MVQHLSSCDLFTGSLVTDVSFVSGQQCGGCHVAADDITSETIISVYALQ